MLNRTRVREIVFERSHDERNVLIRNIEFHRFQRSNFGSAPPVHPQNCIAEQDQQVL